MRLRCPCQWATVVEVQALKGFGHEHSLSEIILIELALLGLELFGDYKHMLTIEVEFVEEQAMLGLQLSYVQSLRLRLLTSSNGGRNGLRN